MDRRMDRLFFFSIELKKYLSVFFPSEAKRIYLACARLVTHCHVANKKMVAYRRFGDECAFRQWEH